jgi:hypothetical protein
MEFSAHVKRWGHSICTDAQNKITAQSLSICASQGVNTLSKYWEQLGGQGGKLLSKYLENSGGGGGGQYTAGISFCPEEYGFLRTCNPNRFPQFS